MFPLLIPLTISIWSTYPVSAISPATPQCPRYPPDHIFGPTQCPPPLDDQSPTTDWNPWSRKPHCERPRENPTQKYCVYTSTTFHHGLGLSLITTPELAASLAPTLTTPNWLRPSSPPFTLRPLPNKGLGAIATRKIPARTPILTDPPVFLGHTRFPEDVDANQGHRLLRRAVEWLPDPGRFLDLARSEGSGEMVDVLSTNAYEVGVGGVAHMGLMPGIARFNHACDPNSFTRFSERRVTMEAVAQRDIEVGEEITVSYIGPEPYERRRQLLAGWGFECRCSLCTAPPDVIRASDERRTRIGSIIEEVGRATSANSHRVLELAKELLELLEAEGFRSKVGEYYAKFARVFYEAGHVGNAKRFAELSLDAWVEVEGEDGDHVKEMEVFLRELKMAKGEENE